MAVLWLAGPPGVGKTTTAWSLYRRLSADGVPLAFVDADQLGMSRPTPHGDPETHSFKAAGARALADVYASQGYHLVVSGGIQTDLQAAVYRRAFERTELLICRLRLDGDLLAARYAARGHWVDSIGEIRDEGAALDRTRFADLVVDVSGPDAQASVSSVLAALGEWPSAAPAALTPRAPAAAPTGLPGRAVVLVGDRAAGVSTAAWFVYCQLAEDGHHVSFVDAAQLDHVARRGPATHELAWAERVRAVVGTSVALGSVELVMAASLDAVPAVRTALGDSASFVVLEVDAQVRASRLAARARGEGVRLPGDDLVGLAEPEQRAVLERPVPGLDPAIPVARLDATGLDPRETAAAVLRLAGN